MTEEVDLFRKLGGEICLVCGEHTGYVMCVEYYDRSPLEPCYDMHVPNNRTRYILTCTGLKCIMRFLDAWVIYRSSPIPGSRNIAEAESDKCAADLDPTRHRWQLTDVLPRENSFASSFCYR